MNIKFWFIFKENILNNLKKLNKFNYSELILLFYTKKSLYCDASIYLNKNIYYYLED